MEVPTHPHDGIRAEEVNTWDEWRDGTDGWLPEKGNVTAASLSRERGEVRSGNLALFSRGARSSLVQHTYRVHLQEK